MRRIGHLSSETAADGFSACLAREGIAHELESEAAGWAVWVHSEDELSRARQLLESFVAHSRVGPGRARAQAGGQRPLGAPASTPWGRTARGEPFLQERPRFFPAMG